jgi:glutamate-5-semialdehyde dehydrogenase
MSKSENLKDVALKAKAATAELAQLDTEQKVRMLGEIAKSLQASQKEIITANGLDLEAAKVAGLSAALIDRLDLNPSRFSAMIEGITTVSKLADPVGQVLEVLTRPNGLKIKKVSVPIGVIAIIYESRPNVTVDSSVLCLMAGNAVILRGGKESIHTNIALTKAIEAGLNSAGVSQKAVQIVKTTDRDAVRELVQLEGYIDLVIPRGGESLIRAVTEQARIPVIKHYKGVCHLFVDREADFEMALSICINAKCQRPGVCNAIETLLVDRKIAAAFVPKALELLRKNNVEVRGDKFICEIDSNVKPATVDDWSEEYLDLVLSIAVVEDVSDAVRHINHYGSHHSDAIVTSNSKSAEIFINGVDSAAVYLNASTRFTDGSEFGLGAEIGISTDKLHARGPMGLKELCTYKYVVEGTGQIRT